MALNRMLGNFNRKLGNFYRKSENFNRKLEETGKNGLEFYLNFILMRFHQLIWTTSKQNVCVMRSQTVYNRKKVYNKKSTIMWFRVHLGLNSRYCRRGFTCHVHVEVNEDVYSKKCHGNEATNLERKKSGINSPYVML